MTYCLGIKTRYGLIGLSDGRITSGSQLSSARKVTMMGAGDNRFFILNSGLRSVRDKTLAYLRRDMERRASGYSNMLDAVAGFTKCLRQVAEEDREALAASKLSFNLHAIIGGQLADDREPYMFLIYPEGNWVEVDERTPYLSIGATAYGKPILDRALSYETDMQTALKIAYLSFDSTRVSSNDVGFPIDMMTYRNEGRVWRQSTFEYDDLSEERLWWNRNLTDLARRMPDGPWVENLVDQADRRPRISLANLGEPGKDS